MNGSDESERKTEEQQTQEGEDDEDDMLFWSEEDDDELLESADDDDDELLESGEEEEEDEEDAILHQDEDVMQLTEQEKEWTRQLMAAHRAQQVQQQQEAEAGHPTTTLYTLTDMEYALHALACEGDVPIALRKIEGLRVFRENYDILDTVEEGIAALQHFLRLNPGFLLHIDVAENRGSAIRAFSYAALDPSVAMRSEANFRAFLAFEYYCETMEQPNLAAVREGVTYMVESSGMGWDNFDMRFEERLHDELLRFSPGKLQKMCVYNSNGVASMVWGLCKNLVRNDWWERMELGCQIEFDPDPSLPRILLPDIFLQPDYERAMKMIVRRARQLLQVRYANQENFRLA